MFGPGLETSTSGIVRKILDGHSDLFTVVSMFPGQFGGMQICYISVALYIVRYLLDMFSQKCYQIHIVISFGFVLWSVEYLVKDLSGCELMEGWRS